MADHDHLPANVGASASFGLKGRCPRCGEGRLFSGFLTVAPRCQQCGLDYDFADSADGPAVFIVLIAGAFIAGLALYVHFAYEPPFWVHVLLWLPLTLIATILPLRPLKGLMIGLQFANQAQEGRLDREHNAP